MNARIPIEKVIKIIIGNRIIKESKIIAKEMSLPLIK
jgi:hypothetical protein